jgi:hypothetical protein
MSPSSRRRLRASLFCASLLFSLTVCERSSLTAPISPSDELVVRVVSGDAQSGVIGLELPKPIVIQALDKRGKPISGQLVNFRVVGGGGSVYAGASSTNRDGLAQE